MKAARSFQELSADRRACVQDDPDVEKVLSAKRFSRYRGVRVWRTNRKRSGCLVVIFLKRGLDPVTGADELRHEYGHWLQLKRLGLWRYFFRIFLPSARSKADNAFYYESPWEVTADVLGGVQSRTHSPEAIDAGFEYLQKAKRR